MISELTRQVSHIDEGELDALFWLIMSSLLGISFTALLGVERQLWVSGTNLLVVKD
jgi:hypothetical protein